MCRSIKQLRNPEGPPTDEALYAAALQYVRKVSGFRKPSQINQEVFDTAVAEIAAATQRLLGQLIVGGSPVSQEHSAVQRKVS